MKRSSDRRTIIQASMTSMSKAAGKLRRYEYQMNILWGRPGGAVATERLL
jgi:hypothetical protein